MPLLLFYAGTALAQASPSNMAVAPHCSACPSTGQSCVGLPWAMHILCQALKAGAWPGYNLTFLSDHTPLQLDTPSCWCPLYVHIHQETLALIFTQALSGLPAYCSKTQSSSPSFNTTALDPSGLQELFPKFQQYLQPLSQTTFRVLRCLLLSPLCVCHCHNHVVTWVSPLWPVLLHPSSQSSETHNIDAY